MCEAFQVLSDPAKRKVSPAHLSYVPPLIKPRQAYDERIQRAQLNKEAWDEERKRRIKEREEWARQAKERSEARMKSRAEIYDNIRKIKEKEVVHTKLVEQFYQELCEQNPEWETRKQEVLKVSLTLLSTSFSLRPSLQRREMREKNQACTRQGSTRQ